MNQQAAVVALGVGMALGHVKPGAEWFEAFADDADEAKDRQAWYEAERAEQEVMAKHMRNR